MLAATITPTTTPDAKVRPPVFEPVEPALLARPLEYLLVDHLRQRHLCAMLERLAGEGAFDARLGRALADYMQHDLAIHRLDDEEDLFPLLRRRAERGDRIEEVLGLLSGEHAAEERLAAAVAEALQSGPEGLGVESQADLRALAERLRRHVAVENAIVMPLAEQRLTAADRTGLARRMAARRGIQLAREVRHG